MPVEPLAVRAEAEARLVIIRWLMHGSVHHEPVETLTIHPISRDGRWW